MRIPLKILLLLFSIAVVSPPDAAAKSFEATPPNLGETLYSVLDVNEHASTSDIRSAYRKLTLKWHPDRATDKEKSTAIFNSIRNAYEVLSDPKKRQIYNFYRESYKDMIEYFHTDPLSSKARDLYKFAKDVAILFGGNFDKHLLESEHVWIINFYHPNCVSCRQKVNFVKALAAGVTSLQRKIRIGVVNCAVSANLCYEFNLRNMGQFVLFPPNQSSRGMWDYKPYTGREDSDSILSVAAKLEYDNTIYLTDEWQISDVLSQYSASALSLLPPVEAILIVAYTIPNCRACRDLKSELRALSNGIASSLRIASFDCSQTRCHVPFYPYLQMQFKRKDSSKIEKVELDFSYNAHPGEISIHIADMFLKEVLGLKATSEQPQKSTSSSRYNSEL